ncbi:MAG: hypothetical protein HLUCCO06_09895 [Halomonas sp. HL-93]|nr:MAG: hypothetical protein HLUCCO06_09895 [Halomonas sp. HL-93]
MSKLAAAQAAQKYQSRALARCDLLAAAQAAQKTVPAPR